jgi:hypothetical protein
VYPTRVNEFAVNAVAVPDLTTKLVMVPVPPLASNATVEFTGIVVVVDGMTTTMFWFVSAAPTTGVPAANAIPSAMKSAAKAPMRARRTLVKSTRAEPPGLKKIDSCKSPKRR